MSDSPRPADIDDLDDLIAGRRPGDRAAPDPDLQSRAAAASLLEQFSESGPRVDEDAVWRTIEAGLERTPQRRPLAWLRGLRLPPPRVPRAFPAAIAVLMLMFAVASAALLLSTETTSADFLEDIEELSAITADALLDGELDAGEVARLDQLSSRLLDVVQSDPAALADLDLGQLSAVIATLTAVRELLAPHDEPLLQQTGAGGGDEQPASDEVPATAGGSPDGGDSAAGDGEPAPDAGSAPDGDEPAAGEDPAPDGDEPAAAADPAPDGDEPAAGGDPAPDGDEPAAGGEQPAAGSDGGSAPRDDDGSPGSDGREPGPLARSLASLGTVSDSVQETFASQLIARAREVCGAVSDEAGLDACEDAVDAAEDACKAYAKAARGACKDDIKSFEKAAERVLRALKAECEALGDKDAQEACKDALEGDDDEHSNRERGGKKSGEGRDEDDHEVDDEDDD